MIPVFLRHMLRFSGLCLLSISLAACSLGERPPSATPPPSPEAAASSTSLPAETPTLTPTALPAPTKTSLPTALPDTGSLPAAGVSGCPITQAPEVGKEADMELGPAEGIPPSAAQGEKLVITGRVYSENCTPLPGANLNVWQTDPEGVYGPGHGGQEMQCCYLQGQVQTDANGYYRLVTLKPGHYKGQNPPPPAHIHLEVSHPQAQTGMLEIVFAGDPHLDLPVLDGLLVVNLENAVSMHDRKPYLSGVADIVLASPQAGTPAAAPEASSGPRTFTILPEKSEAAYQIREKFAVIPIQTSAVAVTRGLEGALTLDLSKPQPLLSMEVTADLSALVSDDPSRDEKLVDRWLVTRQFPSARFAGQRIEAGPETFSSGQPLSFTLIGELTLRDVTRPVSFEVTARLDGDTLTGTATTMIKLTDFGIEPPDLLDMVTVEDEVRLTVNLTAQQTVEDTGG